MKIGEVAGRAGVTVDTVRFYERVGVLPAPARTSSGYRDYQPDTVERIRFTRELQKIGFTLTDAVDALAAHDSGGATCDSERWRLDAALDRVEAKIAELTRLRGRIVEARDACADGHCLFTTTSRAGGSPPPVARVTDQPRGASNDVADAAASASAARSAAVAGGSGGSP